MPFNRGLVLIGVSIRLEPIHYGQEKTKKTKKVACNISRVVRERGEPFDHLDEHMSMDERQ